MSVSRISSSANQLFTPLDTSNMFMQLIQDIECNRCHKNYKNHEHRVMSIVVDHTFLSICPVCTKEIAALMGFTPDEITKHLAMIKYAKTEDNRQYAINHGERCAECEEPFFAEEARIRESNASNVKAWHIKHYEITGNE